MRHEGEQLPRRGDNMNNAALSVLRHVEYVSISVHRLRESYFLVVLYDSPRDYRPVLMFVDIHSRR